MNIIQPIRELIAANTTANNLLSGRVYAEIIAQGSAYPCAALNVTGTAPNNTRTSASDMHVHRLQIDVYGATLASACQASEAIRAAIDYQQTANITGIFLQRIITGYSDVPEKFRQMSEYSVVLKR